MPMFDCPECPMRVIGRYGDLLEHVEDEHPLAAQLVVDSDGKTVADRIKEAQKARLKERINEEMVVSDE